MYKQFSLWPVPKILRPWYVYVYFIAEEEELIAELYKQLFTFFSPTKKLHAYTRAIKYARGGKKAPRGVITRNFPLGCCVSLFFFASGRAYVPTLRHRRVYVVERFETLFLRGGWVQKNSKVPVTFLPQREKKWIRERGRGREKSELNSRQRPLCNCIKKNYNILEEKGIYGDKFLRKNKGREKLWERKLKFFASLRKFVSTWHFNSKNRCCNISRGLIITIILG